MQESKLVSVIIPCYNQGEFLHETLISVFNQTYENWECIVVNDGSTDNTEKIAQIWVAKDNRFIYFKKENGGVSSCRNFGLEKAKGDFIQFLDADDLLAKNKFEISVSAVHQHNVEVVCTNYILFENSTKELYPPFSQIGDFEFNFYNLARYWNDGFTIPIHCWFFRAGLLKNIQFPIGLTAQEDWVTWLRIFQKSPKTFYISQQLAFYRKNPKGRTKTSGFFNETLEGINYLKPLLSEAEFRILYESTLIRYHEGKAYWKKRENNLKKSNTYQFGLLSRKSVKKIGLLKLAKRLFLYVLKFKSK